jgi:hypothetical protein
MLRLELYLLPTIVTIVNHYPNTDDETKYDKLCKNINYSDRTVVNWILNMLFHTRSVVFEEYFGRDISNKNKTIRRKNYTDSSSLECTIFRKTIPTEDDTYDIIIDIINQSSVIDSTMELVVDTTELINTGEVINTVEPLVNNNSNAWNTTSCKMIHNHPRDEESINDIQSESLTINDSITPEDGRIEYLVIDQPSPMIKSTDEKIIRLEKTIDSLHEYTDTLKNKSITQDIEYNRIYVFLEECLTVLERNDLIIPRKINQPIVFKTTDINAVNEEVQFDETTDINAVNEEVQFDETTDINAVNEEV